MNFTKEVDVGRLSIILGFVFLCSALITGLLVASSKSSRLGLDKDSGIQKFHIRPTSRLGGIGIVLSMFLALAYLLIAKPPLWPDALSSITHANVNELELSMAWILVASLPVFLGGLIEDLSHRMTPSVRLFLAIISALLLIKLTGIGVERTDVLPIDWLLKYTIGFYCISLLVVAGFTNACNIIDGFHGLASSQIILMAFFLSVLSCFEQQYKLAVFGALIVASTSGFWIWNWPLGKIFLGDGGAYFLGFIVVSLSLMLVHQSKEISPFAPILVGIYPLTEVLFSMYRRSIVRGDSVNKADALHLHSLIFRRVIKHNARFQKYGVNIQNAWVSVYFAISTFIFGGLACIFFYSSPILVILLIVYIFNYVWSFKRLTSFKSSFWMKILNRPFNKR